MAKILQKDACLLRRIVLLHPANSIYFINF